MTRESATLLDWLDLALTSDYSCTSIVPELVSGGIFANYRVAQSFEVDQLIVNSGVLGAPMGPASEAAFFTLQSILDPVALDDLAGLGCTLALQGLVEPGDGAGAHPVNGIGLDRQPETGDGCGAVLAGSQFVTAGPVFPGAIDDTTTVNAHNASSPITIGGIFLVREAKVPEPDGLGLLAIALAAAIGGFRSRGPARP